ncbi:glycosyltransferase [Micromonospora sp. NPDC005173]|uniref:glycosyltransferase n=1 Tax=Micromonospora sp. NPDC005173 TaxID=3157165 RepID=UPI0033AB8E98
MANPLAKNPTLIVRVAPCLPAAWSCSVTGVTVDRSEEEVIRAVKDRPHVTILIANLPAERDRRVIRECLSLEANGFDVTVIAPRGDKNLRILPGSRGTRLKPYPLIVYGSGVVSYAVEFGWSFLCIAIRLLGELFTGRAHAVQVCNPPDVYFPLALIWRALGRPWVFDHHDLCPEIYVARAGGSANKLVFRALVMLEWFTLRTATAVIATNESFRKNAMRRGVPPEKVTVVRNGPAASEISRDESPVPDRRGNDVHKIVYLGVFGPQDNVEVAVLAAEELAKRRSRRDWRMVLAGDGETMVSLTKLAAERGLNDLVEFTGWLDGPAVDSLLRTATIAIQPDLPTRMNHLSTMAKTVEYLGRGIPVVAVDLIETQRSADAAALYVPNGSPAEFAEAIDRLLDDTAQREQMHDVALSRFTTVLAWEHQAQQYVSLWRRLLARRLGQPVAAGPDAPRSPRSTTADHAVHADRPAASPLDAVHASVVIAAHNEAGVIGRCLDTLMADARDGEFDITVVANGCTDSTAQIAGSRPGVRVVELGVAGKPAALNAGDVVAVGFPRIYLDADVVVTTQGLRLLADAVRPPLGAAAGRALAVVPRRGLDLTRRPLLIRAYFAIHRHLPAFRDGLFGRGVIALSAEGRKRFKTFPDMVADDLFLDSLFERSEKREVSGVTSLVATPHRVADLVRRLTRVRSGNAAMRATASSESAPTRVRAARRLSWLRDVVLPRPWLAPAAVCYVAISLAAASRARRVGRGEQTWERDESSRRVPTVTSPGTVRGPAESIPASGFQLRDE